MSKAVLAVARTVLFASVVFSGVPAEAQGVLRAFSLPGAPVAGQIKTLFAEEGVIVAPLTSGSLKYFLPGRDGGLWGAIAADALAADVSSLPIHGKTCREWLNRPPVIGMDGAPSPEASARSACVLLLSHLRGGTGQAAGALPGGLSTEFPGEGSKNLIERALEPGEEIRGMATVEQGGGIAFLVATQDRVHLLASTKDGVSTSSVSLNRPPVFEGPASITCREGDGVVNVPVRAKDPDGDRVVVVDLETGKELPDGAIRHTCSAAGTFLKTVALSDGRVDETDRPVATFSVRVLAAVNAPPVWADFELKGPKGASGRLPSAKDPDGDKLTYSGEIPHIEIAADGGFSTEAEWCGKTEGRAWVSDGKNRTTVTARVDIPCGREGAKAFTLSVSPEHLEADTPALAAAISAIDGGEGASATIVIRKAGKALASGATSASVGGPFLKGDVYTVEAVVDELRKEVKREVKNSPPFKPVNVDWPAIAAEKNLVILQADAGLSRRDPDPADNAGPCPGKTGCVTYVWGGTIPKGLAPDPKDSSVLRGTIAPDFISGSAPALTVDVDIWVQKKDSEGATSEKLHHTMRIINMYAPF